MKQIITFSIVFLLEIGTTLAISVNDDLTLTYGEKLALDKFKDRVRSILPHRYMREDTYLINWLRAKDFNVAQAEKFLKENLRWRKENRVDKIHEEDFSELLDEYKVQVDTYDKNGAPVMTVDIKDWDMRKAVLFRMQNQLRRLVIKIFDEASIKVREAQMAGKNVTRFHQLWNLKSFSLAQHGCLSCMVEIRGYFQIYENYFPGMTDYLIMFNSPPQLQIIRPMVREALSGNTRSHLNIIGRNKAEWQRILFQFIDPSQLTEDFGGTRHRNSKTDLDDKLISNQDDQSELIFSS